MKIDKQKTVQVEAKELRIYMKVRDTFSADLCDADGETIHRQEDGYVPGFMPDDHYGDYLILNIDIDTGQVVNWTPPTKQQIVDWMTRDD
jgi:hypothetical protein